LTLFNALAQRSIAQAANFPFCTIEPNLAPIAVPDPYLTPLGVRVANSTKMTPATMDWVDVVGLAKGANRGEGLENYFLATLRECHAICHLVRTFPIDENDSNNNNVIHVEGKVDPIADAEVINLELLLADLEHVQRRLEKSSCQGLERLTLEKIKSSLEQGILARATNQDHGQQRRIW
jgi:ribosome-binding ATPase YchF (GTP1/OBG family)